MYRHRVYESNNAHRKVVTMGIQATLRWALLDAYDCGRKNSRTAVLSNISLSTIYQLIG